MKSPITADNYGDYLLKTYLQPSATTYLAALSAADRATYLAANPFISYTGGAATFTWNSYLAHVGARTKTAPAFDAFDLSAAENNLFGKEKSQARHFTDYSNQHASGRSAALDADIPDTLNQLNAMYHLVAKNSGRAKNWWLRVGTRDTDTALTVNGNFALAAAALGDNQNTKMYWDAGHGANDDPADFISWVSKITA
ncbi:MAG TPA: hypothetical protein VIK13_00055 [Candidatus Limnocylindrales bacterium]